MHIFFLPLYDFFRKRKPVFWLIFLATFIFWIGCALRLNLKEDISDMLPDSKALKAMNDVINKTDAGEQVIFLMSFEDNTYKDQDSLVSAATILHEDIAANYQDWIDTIILQPGSGYEERLVDIISNNLPLFLNEADYQRLDTLTQPQRIESTLEQNKKVLLSPAGFFYKKLIANDPIGMSGLVWGKLKELQFDPNYEVYDGYLFHKQKGTLTFFLKPKYKAAETGKNSTFFESLNEYIKDWEQKHAGIQVTYFGGPAVAAGNATQMRTDTIVTLSVTIILLLALTFYFFRRKRMPLLLLVPVAYGAAMGLGIIALFQGSISIIALGAGAIVMGIAIDFSIHFLSHTRTSDIRTTVKELAQPLTIGSFTTIAAFLSLRFVDTPILQDLGLFAATSLAGAALCTLIFLPHLPIGVNTKTPKRTLFDKLAELRPEKNKWLVLFIFLFTPVMLYFAQDVSFDSDLMHLNYLSPEMQKAQDEVSEVNASALSSIFVVASGADNEKALQNLEQVSQKIDTLRNEGAIRGVSNPTLLLSSQKAQQEKLDRWNNYWTAEKKNDVLSAVASGAKNIGFSDALVTSFASTLNTDYSYLSNEDVALMRSMFPSSFTTKGDEHFAVAALKVPKENREAVFNSLSEYDNVVVADRQQGATQLVTILNNDFNHIALYSAFIVFFALLISYGRFELAIIAFLPMAMSWVWILGLMSLLGLKFNIVNIIISTLIFGLGDDYTIFTMDGLIDRYKTGKPKLASVRAAVYISVLTVIIGLGVLLLAKHPALRSIAFVSVTGLLCVLFISQTLQPFLFNWFIQNRANKKFLPFTLWSFSKSVFAFAYFFSGSLVLTIAGVILTKLWPFGKERGKYIFHAFISKYTWSMMYIMGNVTKRVHNLSHEQFDKPAVVITNHSSFLDILITTMLNPRLVLLTNRWVWRSPVFGAVVRMAEYYPVADGAEDSVEPLRDLTSRGYSVVVFPEGTRSYDDKIKRFHKGAFYIAEQLKLDVIPVVLHGVHYTMQKGDWLLKDGTCSVYIHDRIAPDNDTYGQNYSERAKYMGKWMRKELDNVKEKNETPSYFREQLLRSYTYKGPVLEWYCRVKTSLEGNYEQFHELLPREGMFYDLGCGYGFMTYMLHWAAPKRRFIGVDYDGEKIETAQNNFMKDENINFEQGDVTQLKLQACDGIIISDVLHYLLPDQQQTVLNNALAALNPGGRLIIRDGISELKGRIEGTKLTEVFSTKVFGFNKTQNDLHFISRTLIEDFAAQNGLTLTEVDNAKFTANLIFVLQKQ